MRALLTSTVAVGLLLFVTQGVRADDDARAILEKAAKAHYDARAILEKAAKAHYDANKLGKSPATLTKAKGTSALPGGVTFTDELMTQPGCFKSVSEIKFMNQTIKRITAFDGKKAWISMGGTTTELDGKILDEVKEGVYAMSLSTYAFLKDKNYEVSSLGELKVNGRPALGVKIATKGHRDIKIYFDMKTGLVAKMERQLFDPTTGKDITEERIITEYQDVDGVKVAKKEVINRDGKKHLDMEVTEVKFRDKFDESEFVKP